MDSADHIVRAMQYAADDAGVPTPTDAAVRAIIGLGLPEAIAVVFPHEASAKREQIRQGYAHHFVQGTGGAQSTLFDGVPEMLDRLLSQGHRLAIATGKTRIGLDRVLGGTGLSPLFLATRCADETASKPNPLMLAELLKETGTGVNEAFMIGDTTYDMEMAYRLDMPRVGVSYGVHSVDELNVFSPQRIVDDVKALSAYLTSV